jgi:transcriptional regulator NrdR family protein
MKTHKCLLKNFKTINSRKRDGFVIRRRECKKCKRRITTREYFVGRAQDE